MNKNSVLTQSRFLPLCLAAYVVSAPVYATTITGLQADADYTLGAAPLPPTPAPVVLGPQIAMPPGSTSVDILQFTPDIYGNNIGIHTYADSTSASFGSRASGDGSYDVTSNIKVTGDFTGDTFSSSIIPGQVYVQIPAGYVFGAGEFVSAHLKFSLVVDGGTPFLSEASLNWSTAGLVSNVSETAGGFNIGYSLTTAATFANYGFGPSTQMINGFGVGTHTFEYNIFAEAHGLTHSVTCVGDGGGNGQHPGDAGVAAVGDGSTGQGGCQPGSGAQSGDPLHSLPEPDSMALMGLGLGLFAWSSRQQQGKSQSVA